MVKLFILWVLMSNFIDCRCRPAKEMLQGNGDLKRKWTWAVEWLNDELERVSGKGNNSIYIDWEFCWKTVLYSWGFYIFKVKWYQFMWTRKENHLEHAGQSFSIAANWKKKKFSEIRNLMESKLYRDNH